VDNQLIYGTFSAGIAKRRHLPAALGAKLVLLGRREVPDNLAGIVGWGLKENTRKSRNYADHQGLPYLNAEDGFIRSIGLGVNGAEPFGFILDRSGIYYDATRPSDLETMIRRGAAVGDVGRARKLIDRIVGERIYKYNHVWDSVALPREKQPRVLLVDQTRNDKSVACGLADAGSFRRMLAAAREQYPAGKLFVKTHPDVIAGKKRGYLTADLPADIAVIGEDCNPQALIQQVDHVFTVTSQMGFDALLAGKRVSCFGMPFYAGWGLTEDAVHCPRRDGACSLETLFDLAFLQYVRYVDPLTGRPCELERIIERIAAHKRVVAQNSGTVFCFGFRFWKHGIVRRYLESANADIRFVRSIAAAEKAGLDASGRMATWGLRHNPALAKLARRHGIRVERIEDGFIRSVGLGSDFARPASLIVDRKGIYFDPRRPSDLEDLFSHAIFTDAARSRARKLRKAIVSLGMSKYNAGSRQPLNVGDADGRTIVLVPGQVEDDASIAAGCVDVRTNLRLLQEVRRSCPKAYIIYKPHPDVLAGNRRGRLDRGSILNLCDRIVTEHDISACLEAADQVHTMTSLTGFEALMRKKKVFTYGLPFYAGWGLTQDRHRIARRKRRLTLDELVYGTLIGYPRYYDWQARCFVTAEDVVAAMRRQRMGRNVAIKPPLHRHLRRKARYLIEDLLEAWWRK
jgi:capsular polysaccharide export protein